MEIEKIFIAILIVLIFLECKKMVERFTQETSENMKTKTVVEGVVEQSTDQSTPEIITGQDLNVVLEDPRLQHTLMVNQKLEETDPSYSGYEEQRFAAV